MTDAWTDVDALVFDLDGVITDTADQHFRAWKRMLDDHLRDREQDFVGPTCGGGGGIPTGERLRVEAGPGRAPAIDVACGERTRTLEPGAVVEFDLLDG